jgi:hypothetical protein
MKAKKYVNLLMNLLLALGLITGASGFTPNNIQAAQEPPPPIVVDGQYIKEGRITAGDIQAAALAARRKGVLPGLAGNQGLGLSAVMTPDLQPHFYGPFANYANSPMPKGPISYVTIEDPGSGYTNPTVTILDVYDTGSGATAVATLSGGSISGISVTNPGANYSAPIVLIEDPTGVDALASAMLGPTLTGGIRKFVDGLPGLGVANANALGQYIPVAIPDTTTFLNTDYYEIELGQYTEQLHSDLPPTTLNGYRQTNTTDATVSQFHYLGPMIIANKDRAVRIKFTNNKVANGDFFLPVDTTVMGAGQGPLNAANGPCDPIMEGTCEYYSENRSTVHLHGAFVPWISDGTPHQWTTPAGENTKYPNGVSVQYVPDMWFDASGNVIPGASLTPPVAGATNNPSGATGHGSLSFYYNNQQSARLMFYHDHAFGITRLNVYAGEAAGYIITDQIEQDLINGTNVSGVNPGLVQLPGYGIPLILQDKTFVDATTIAAQDPTWRWGTNTVLDSFGYPTPKTGDLWMSSVYMPGQNPYDPTGTNAFGRWQYGPYFWPPTSEITHGPVANEYFVASCDPSIGFCEPPLRPGTPARLWAWKPIWIRHSSTVPLILTWKWTPPWCASAF